MNPRRSPKARRAAVWTLAFLGLAALGIGIAWRRGGPITDPNGAGEGTGATVGPTRGAAGRTQGAGGAGNPAAPLASAAGDRVAAASRPAAVSVDGTVELVGEGWPAALGEVVVELASPQSPSAKTLEIHPAGKWQEDLSEGEWRVLAYGARGRIPLPVSPDALLVEADARDLAFRNLALAVERVPSHEGVVVDCAGDPVAGVTVFLEARDHLKVRSTAEGAFSLPAYRGRDGVVLVDEDSLPEGAGPPWWQNLQPHEIRADVHLAGTGEDTTLRLTGAMSQRVHVTEANGQAIPRTTVALTGRFRPDGAVAGPNYVFQTDPGGRFELPPLAPGRYEARLYRTVPGMAKPAPVPIEIDCGSADEELQIVLPTVGDGGCLRGVARDHTGAGIAELRFGVWPADGPAGGMRLSTLARGAMTTDSDGRFHLCGLEAGDYVLVRTQGQTPDSSLSYFDDVTELTFTIDEQQPEVFVNWGVEAVVPGTLVGQVGEETRAAIERSGNFGTAVVTMSCAHGISTSRRLHLDANGGFRELLPPGAGEIAVYAAESLEPEPPTPDTWLAAEEFALAPGGTVALVVGP